jgi:hypothetical protein
MPDFLIDYVFETIVVPLHKNGYIRTTDPSSAEDFPRLMYSMPNPPEHHHPQAVTKSIGTLMHDVMRQARTDNIDIPVEIVDNDLFITIPEQIALIHILKFKY